MQPFLLLVQFPLHQHLVELRLGSFDPINLLQELTLLFFPDHIRVQFGLLRPQRFQFPQLVLGRWVVYRH